MKNSPNKILKRAKTTYDITKFVFKAVPYVVVIILGMKVFKFVKKIKISAKDLTVETNQKLKYVISMGDVTLIDSPADNVIAGNMITANGSIKRAIAGNCILANGSIEKATQGNRKDKKSCQ